MELLKMKFIANFILYFIALFLVLVFCPIGMFFARITQDFKTRSKWYYDMAFALDIFGNVACQYLFNVTLTKQIGHAFGNPKETVSYALGMNYYLNNLTFLGKALVWILDKIEKDHVQKAVKNNNPDFYQKFLK